VADRTGKISCDWMQGACDMLHALMAGGGRQTDDCLVPLETGVEFERKEHSLVGPQSAQLDRARGDLAPRKCLDEVLPDSVRRQLATLLPARHRGAIHALLSLVLLASACSEASPAQGGLPAQAAAGLATARHWQPDAVLVSIEAQDYARNGRFFLTFSYYSPSAGTGLWIVSAPGQGDQVRLHRSRVLRGTRRGLHAPAPLRSGHRGPQARAADGAERHGSEQ
jgi:hypothetical protein